MREESGNFPPYSVSWKCTIEMSSANLQMSKKKTKQPFLIYVKLIISEVFGYILNGK